MFDDHNISASGSRMKKTTSKGGPMERSSTRKTAATPKGIAVRAQKPAVETPIKSVRKQKTDKVSRPPQAEPVQKQEVIPPIRPAPAASEEIGAAGQVSTALTAYFRDVGGVPLLSREEEIELAAKIKRGDDAARERMIRANLRLVVKIARDYENLGLPLLDLISEGTIGLMKAVEKFDPAKGGKLSTYGSWWIKQQIRRALANQSRTIRLPVHVEGKLYQLGRAEAKLRDIFGREATDEELADELGMTTKRITRLKDAAIRPSSLDAPMGEDHDGAVGDLVRDERATTPFEEYQNKADHGMLRELMHQLPERESQILKSRFGLDGENELTLEEIGHRFGVTRERIRQLQNDAFKKLRQLMEDPELLQLAD